MSRETEADIYASWENADIFFKGDINFSIIMRLIIVLL